MRPVGPKHTTLEGSNMKIAKEDCYASEVVAADGTAVRRFIRAGDPVPPNFEIDSKHVIERDEPAKAETVVQPEAEKPAAKK